MWKKLGVQVSLVNQEWKTHLETQKQGNFDVGRAGWIADYNEASSMLDLMQTTTATTTANTPTRRSTS